MCVQAILALLEFTLQSQIGIAMIQSRIFPDLIQQMAYFCMEMMIRIC